MTVNEIIRMIERSVPKTLAMQWDNPGLLVGRGDREVSCIYVALDCTEPVIPSGCCLWCSDDYYPSPHDFFSGKTDQ